VTRNLLTFAAGIPFGILCGWIECWTLSLCGKWEYGQDPKYRLDLRGYILSALLGWLNIARIFFAPFVLWMAWNSRKHRLAWERKRTSSSNGF
jgi:hypothetical protein